MGFIKNLRATIISLRQAGQQYVETQLQLLKLQAAEKISALLANIIAALVLSFFLLFFLLFASVALAHVLSDWIGRSYAGYLIVAGLYLLSGLVIFKNKEGMLRRPIMNSIIRQLFADNPPGKDKENANGS